MIEISDDDLLDEEHKPSSKISAHDQSNQAEMTSSLVTTKGSTETVGIGRGGGVGDVSASLIRKRPLPASSTERGVAAVAPIRTTHNSADTILDKQGSHGDRIADPSSSSTKKHKSLKPDWLLKKERLAEERERNKRFDTPQALGFSSKDPKAKLHSFSQARRPAPLIGRPESSPSVRTPLLPCT